MKYLVLSLLLVASTSFAEDATIYKVDRETGLRDYSAPAYRVDGDKIYQINRETGLNEYNKPIYRVEDNRIYQINRETGLNDYSKPQYKIEPFFKE